jgi:hypothetical protein
MHEGMEKCIHAPASWNTMGLGQGSLLSMLVNFITIILALSQGLLISSVLSLKRHGHGHGHGHGHCIFILASHPEGT